MDITPFLHALCAEAAQLLIGLFYRELGLRGDSRLYVLHCA